MGNSVRARAGAAAVALSFALLLLVGVAGPNAAKPGLGPRGWAPGDLAWAPSPALVTALLWAAYLLGGGGVALRLVTAGRTAAARAATHAGDHAGDHAGTLAGTLAGALAAQAAARWPGWRWPLLLAVGALLTGPFGSADHTNYAAYGRIAAQGGDPYLTAPDAWPASDPVTSAVEPPWRGTVSIYGPFATALQALASLVGGANLRQTVWVWQLLVVVAWLLVRWLLLRAGAAQQRVDTLWTFNPLVFGIGVLGAHVDLLAAALALAAIVLAARNPWLGGLVGGLAVSTKVTFGIAGVALLVAWWGHERSGFARRVVALVVGAVVVVVPLHLWAGPHVFDQLDRARRSISLATPWRLVFEWLAGGPMAASTARDLVSVGSVVLAVVFVVLLARLTRGLAPDTATGTAARWVVVLSAAYTLAAPYSLPWYDLLAWVALPVLAPGVVDLLLLGRLTAMAVAYVPGRVVGMTRTVQDLTLGVRRRVVPYAVLAVWGWLTLAATRASSRASAPRPPAP
ncbi:hypothetical protein ASD62_11035 [Phycicoccus sp. Root563]|uniref:hypothetical protein n=1 Tax=Phycicoccus sp. Root563 TaxID=1736562 RepID=UPI000703304E|nr:hypothetical protein [Phycicoccus sp. Root563]KQZ89758.1 hypothetical protein ASD62_11035 [Phycicoccus sp. Root563]